MLEFKSHKIEIYTVGVDKYRLIVFGYPRLSSKINKILKCFEDGSFGKYDEPQFTFSSSQIQSIRDGVPIMDRIFAQILKPSNDLGENIK